MIHRQYKVFSEPLLISYYEKKDFLIIRSYISTVYFLFFSKFEVKTEHVDSARVCSYIRPHLIVNVIFQTWFVPSEAACARHKFRAGFVYILIYEGSMKKFHSKPCSNVFVGGYAQLTITGYVTVLQYHVFIFIIFIC